MSNEKIIKWEEVEYPAVFTSANASIQQGFQQFNADCLKVVEFVNCHNEECKECSKDWDCDIMHKAKKEVDERFKDYNDFFGVVRTWGRISRWAGK